MRLGGMVGNEVAKLRKIKECDHVWSGPVVEVQGNHDLAAWYLVNCKHCDLASGKATWQEAEVLIAAPNDE